MFFLVENRPIRTPPLLVENSTNFLFETFPKGYNVFTAQYILSYSWQVEICIMFSTHFYTYF